MSIARKTRQTLTATQDVAPGAKPGQRQSGLGQPMLSTQSKLARIGSDAMIARHLVLVAADAQAAGDIRLAEHLLELGFDLFDAR